MCNLILFLMILSCNSYEIIPKFCINCKYFIPSELNNNEYGKCSMFKILDQNNNFLITGIKSVKKEDYYYCSTTRDMWHMCGINGRVYEEKLKTYKNINFS